MAKRWSGYLILGMWLLNLLHLYLGLSPWPAAIAAWGASLLTWPWLVGAARRQALALYGAALLLLIFSWWQGATLTAGDWLLPNINMLTMFAAVSTLNLATSGLLTGTTSWTGRKGLWSTMASLNLLGAVINLSVLFIIGDRLERNGTLERRQVMVLSRIFCAAAFWSPFFVAMAVALTYAPGLQLSHILPFGILAALLAMGLTAWQVERIGVDDFAGYPLRLQTLGLPVALAMLVLLIKQIWPQLGILAVIALVAPLLALLFMPRGGRKAALKRQVVERFPAIGGQLVLFLGAGLLAAGINSALSVIESWLRSRLAAVQSLWLARSIPHSAADPAGGHRRGASAHQHLRAGAAALAAGAGSQPARHVFPAGMGACHRHQSALRIQSGAGLPL